MSFAEIDAGVKRAPPHRSLQSNRKVDRYHSAFRRRLGVVAIGLLLVNLGLGLFARQQQQATMDRAINVFDNAFISPN